MRPSKKEVIGVLILLAISGIAHSINMFDAPFYFDDEGTYMAQAWSVLTQGELSPYTYWYDHAPAGWLFIALWVKLSGGFFTFGTAVNSGRVFMLVLQLFSTFFVYYIGKKISGKITVGILAGLLFSLLPMGIFFHRAVLLDNIMVFWVLASATFLFKNEVRLHHIIFSALCFGIAVLTKENAIFFLPAFIFLIYRVSQKNKLQFAYIKWIFITIGIIALYPLYALSQSELFPSGATIQGPKSGIPTQDPGVSLLEALLYQSSRGVSIFNPNSSIWTELNSWITESPIFMVFGALSVVFLIKAYYNYKRIGYLFISLLGIGQFLFFFRGGTIFSIYIVVLIPVFALAIALSLDVGIDKLRQHVNIVYPQGAKIVIFSVVGLYLSLGYILYPYYATYNIYTSNQTESQLKALTWIRQNMDPNAKIAIGNWAFVDLHAASNPGGNIYMNAEHFWRIRSDYKVRQQFLDNKTANLDSIVLTSSKCDLLIRETSPSSLMHKVIIDSQKRVTFKEGDMRDVVVLYPQTEEKDEISITQNQIIRNKCDFNQ